MAALFEIDGFDLWPFTRVSPGDGLTPVDADQLSAAFGEAGGLEGEPVLSLAAANAEIEVPVHLSPRKVPALGFATTKDGLHALVTDVNRRLRAARRLEWREDGATASTWRDVLFARFEPAYDYRRAGALWVSGVVRLQTKPYGHTGALRLAASSAASGIALTLPIASLAGDAPALADVQVRTGSQPVSEGRIIGAAALPTGYVADWSAASVTLAAGALVGASGAAGSQYVVATLSSPRTPVEIGRITLSPASLYDGRNRLLAVAAGDADMTLTAYADDGTRIGGGNASSWSNGGYGTVDLGVLDVDSVARDTAVIRLVAENPAPPLGSAPRANELGWGHIGDAAVRLNRLLIVPEADVSLVLDSQRRRLSRKGAFNDYPLTDDYGSPIDDFTPWSASAPAYQQAFFDPIWGTWLGDLRQLYGNGGFGLRRVGRSVEHEPASDIKATMHLAYRAQGTPALTGTPAAWLGKRHHGATSGVSAVYAHGPNTSWLSIWEGLPLVSPGTLRASVTVGAVTSASQAPEERYLEFHCRGPHVRARVMDSRGAQLAELTTTATGTERPGILELGMQSNTFEVTTAGWRAAMVPSQNMVPRDRLEMAATKDAANRMTSGGVAHTDVGRGWRGGPLVVDPTRHGQVVAFSLPLDGQAANGLLDASVQVLERFAYAR